MPKAIKLHRSLLQPKSISLKRFASRKPTLPAAARSKGFAAGKMISESENTEDWLHVWSHKLDQEQMLLKLNVGGSSFLLLQQNVEKYPKTRLYYLIEQPIPNNTLLNPLLNSQSAEFGQPYDAFLSESGEYFFDRSATIFKAIATFFRVGIIHKPENVCLEEFMDELYYFGILPNYSALVCLYCGNNVKKCLNAITKNNNHDASLPSAQKDDEVKTVAIGENCTFLQNQPTFEGSKMFSLRCNNIYQKLREHTWEVTSSPEASCIAWVFATLSILFIIATVCIMVMESLPQFQLIDCGNGTNLTATAIPNEDGSEATMKGAIFDCDKYYCENRPPSNGKCKDSQWDRTTWACTCIRTKQDLSNCNKVTHPNLELLEIAVISWFTFEYVIRCWAAPEREKFFTDSMSIIDLLSIFPFYLELLLRQFLAADALDGSSLQAARGIRIIRLFRILRLLKLSRYSKGMQVLALSLKRSAPELGLMLFYTLLTTMFFSSLLYYLESGAVDTTYTSIPTAAWWSMEAPPVTVGGKLVAASGTMAGVILLALPITIIVDKFGRTYEELQENVPPPPHGSRMRTFRI